MNSKLVLMLIGIFLITQTLGLIVADKLITEEISAPLVTDNPQDIENSIGLFVYIIVFTAILLIFIKFFAKFSGTLFKLMELLAIFAASTLVSVVFINSIFALIIPITLIALRIIFSKNIWLRNLTSVIATAGAGALIGVSLGIIPVIVLIILLAVYDFIAVFKTKHMVTLAKSITKKNLSFTYALPTKEHQFELGTGDLVIPLVFSASLLSEFKGIKSFPEYFFPSIIILIVSLIGLIITMEFVSKNKTPLPALPLQSALMIIVYLIISLIF
jgi:presenilin-like A22 family membrane protease